MPSKERVYRLHSASAPEDVGLLANWLQSNGRGLDDVGQPKAVAVAIHQTQRKTTLAFATPREAVTLDLKAPIAPALLGVCRSVLVEQPQIDLRCRDMYRDIVDLSQFFAKEFSLPVRDVYNNLAPACTGDLRQAAGVSGLPITEKKSFRDVADDAYEVALYGPQYEHAIPPYYSRVSLPFGRLQAESSLLRSDPERVDWWASYPDLWLRVFAHFAGDPTLLWLLDQRLPVRETVARTLKTTEAQAEALLLWQAHARDMTALMRRCPGVVDALPDDLPTWARALDRHYPTLCASTIQMWEAYQQQRSAHTLYGRMLRGGHSAGEATSFRIFGTVEDIIAVAAVTFWQARISREIMVTKIEGGLDAPLIRIKGEGPSAGKDMWRQVLSPLVSLDNPIRASLEAQAVFP